MISPKKTAGSVRRKVSRALSFDGSVSPIRRVLSSDKKKSKEKFHKIVASDDVHSEEVWDGLRQLKTNTKIENVEIVDLLVSGANNEYITMIQDTLFAEDGTQIRKVLFADTMSMRQYDSWRERKEKMMDAYKQGVKDNNCQTGAAWQATFVMHQGTDLVSMEEFLSNLQGDLSCNNVSFDSASLKNTTEVFEIPETLCSLIGGGETLQLKEDVSVHVACGWGETGEWSKLLERCTTKLSKLLSKDGKKGRTRSPRRRTKSNSTGIAQMRRTKTTPEPIDIQRKINNVKKNVYLRRSKTLEAEAKKDTPSSSDDNKSLNTSATSLSSSASAASDNDASSSSESNNERKPERTTISWKEFGDRNKQRLALRIAATMEARMQHQQQQQEAPHAA